MVGAGREEPQMTTQIGGDFSTTKVIIAIIYARVSTAEQKNGFSLEVQIADGRAYAENHQYIVVEVFQEIYTGESLDRPALDALRDYIKMHKVDIVIVSDVDRWARKMVFQQLLDEEFRRKGLRIEYIRGQYEDSAEGELQKQVKGAFSEYEKAKILLRSRDGKRGKALHGYVNVSSRPPYGYAMKSEPHKELLVIDEEEKKTVLLVYTLFTIGDPTIPRATRGKKEDQRWSLREIALYLTKLGLPTRGDKHAHYCKKQGFGVWTSAMIRNILRNETYVGRWYYGKTHMVSDGKEATREQKPKIGRGKQV